MRSFLSDELAIKSAEIDFIAVPTLSKKKNNMASLQSKILMRYLHMVQRMLVNREKHKDIPFLRRGLAISAARAKVPSDVKMKDLEIKPHIPAIYFKPEESRRNIILLYLHGGGYAVGSAKTHKSLVAKIAQTAHIRSLSVSYRLAPEHPFPAALDDAIDAYVWLLNEGYEPQNIVFGGDSAGGGLTIATLLHLKREELPMPAAGICLSPWTDLSGTSYSAMNKDPLDPMLKSSELTTWGQNYAGQLPINHPSVSPLYATDQQLAELPPLLIQVGTNEILEDDSINFAKKANQAGAKVTLDVWKDMFHVWQFFWQVIPEAKEAIQQLSSFINEKVGQS